MAKKKRILVTDDKSMHKKSNIDPADAEIFKSVETGEGLIQIKSAEQLEAIAKGLFDAFNSCLELCQRNMTSEQAKLVRKLRVDDGYSWRAVAHACHDERWWGDDPYWDRVPAAQPMGMALCEVAASFFSEDHMQPPWN